MQCDYCDSTASVFFTQIVDGETKKSSLCEKCAVEHGVTDPKGFLIGHIHALGGKEESAKPETPVESAGEASAAAVCPGCGFAFDDLKKTGRLGCSECYQFFRSDIKHNLGGMHKGVSHHGRVPVGMLEAFEKRQQLECLEQEMNEAVKTEDYEKAAALRDQLNQLREQDQVAAADAPNS